MLLSFRIMALTGLFALIANGVFVPSIVRADEPDPGLARPPSVSIDSYIQFNNPQVPIPGLNPKMMIVAGKGVSVNGCPEGAICARTISSYLNAFYRYAAAAAISFAIVLIMVGGIQYTVGSAMGQIDAGKKRMWNAVIGLVLVLSTHAILSFVNPDIVTLGPLALDVVKNVPQSISYRTTKGSEGDPVNVSSGQELRSPIFGCSDSEVKEKSGESVCLYDGIEVRNTFDSTTPGAPTMHKDVVDAFQKVVVAMYQLYGEQKSVILRGAYENPVPDAAQFLRECIIGGSCESICDPFGAEIELSPWQKQVSDGKTTYVLKEAYNTIFEENGGDALKPEYTKLLPDMKNFSCPQHSGKRLNVTCGDGSGGPKDLRITNGRCQAILEQLMKQNGFCRSYAEPWLFIHGTSYLDQACDWIPGTARVNKDGNDASDEVDCTLAVMAGSPTSGVFRMDKYAESRDNACIMNYALSANTFDAVRYVEIGPLRTAPHIENEEIEINWLAQHGLLPSSP